MSIEVRDKRALVAVDLGAESCRVSLLRLYEDKPRVELVHRFANGPRVRDGGLRWDLHGILAGVEHGLRLAERIAAEGVRSIAVDGWAVDYVRLDEAGVPLGDPFCYRDERTLAAERSVHEAISPERLREITGIEQMRINTLYQLHADRLAGLPGGTGWLNLPEYVLHWLGGRRVAERTNASHTQMQDLAAGGWSEEIFAAAGLDVHAAPELVEPGTVVGRVRGPMAELARFRETVLIAPACHDTAAAIAGILAAGEDWAYISSGTWSLVGTVLREPCNGVEARAENFTNLAGVGGRVCFHKNVNGMWLLRQCMEAWAAAGQRWTVGELVSAAFRAAKADALLDLSDPDILLAGEMPGRFNRQRAGLGLAALDEGDAPMLARLIFESLAARYAEVLGRMARLTGKRFARIYIVGGGSRNELLNRLTAEATGLEVVRGAEESSTIGNFAVQLAALEGRGVTAEAVAGWAGVLQGIESQ